MRTFSFPAFFEPGDEAGFVVTFADVPEAITDGATIVEARAMAEDALGVALLTYLQSGRPLPHASPREEGQVIISPSGSVTAKLAVIEAFNAAGLSSSELARRLGKDERDVRRILDPKHATRLVAPTDALAALGKRLVIGVEAA